ncbi:MAG: hypothetical protein AAF449_07065 [Myxococcota bacterium]
MSALFVLLAVASPPSLAFDQPKNAPGWIQARAETVLRRQLLRRGIPSRPSLSLASPGPSDAVVNLELTPKRVERAMQSIQIRVRLSKPRAQFSVRGSAANLSTLLSGLADRVASVHGKRKAAFIDDSPLPFIVHRELGKAAIRLRKEKIRQAMLAFDRVGRRAKTGPMPDAHRGRRRAFQALVHQGQARLDARSDLAVAAAERAEVATRQRQGRQSQQAWESFLRYTDNYAERWRVRANFSDGARLFEANDSYALVGGDRRWSLDPRTGFVDEGAKTEAGVIDVWGEEALHLSGRRLMRRRPDGSIRWTAELPAVPAREDGVFVTSGVIGVVGATSVAWLDAGLGQRGQVATDVKPLAASPGGVLVVLPRPDERGAIGLLRPGKRTPAWRTTVANVWQARLTRERAVLATDDALHILRSHNGSPARSAIRWRVGHRLLHAEGRYGTATDDRRTVVLIDILTGQKTGEIEGPGRPRAALTLRDGVAVLFDTGDLFQLGREAKILDRARPPGRPLQLVRGHPLSPGPIVVTTEGVFAYTEVRSSTLRDVDAYLAMARWFQANGRESVALRLLSSVIDRGAGRIAEAKTLRAQWLATSNHPDAKAFAQSAARARDATEPMSE